VLHPRPRHGTRPDPLGVGIDGIGIGAWNLAFPRVLPTRRIKAVSRDPCRHASTISIEPDRFTLARRADPGDFGRMTAAQQQPGFMDRPAQAQAPAPAHSPQGPTPDRSWHFAYSLPPSVRDQYHWKGTEADLHYGLVEPTVAQIDAIGRDPGRSAKAVATSFIHHTGGLDADGNVILGEDGHPALFLRSVYEMEAWYDRIGAKGVQLVVGEFQALFQPTAAEGEAHRASRRRG